MLNNKLYHCSAINFGNHIPSGASIVGYIFNEKCHFNGQKNVVKKGKIIGTSPTVYHYGCCFFGDSITAGTSASIPYPWYISLNSIYYCRNFGVSGTGYTVKVDGKRIVGGGVVGRGKLMEVPFEDNTFLGAIKYYQNEIDKDDAIIINGGTNDFYNNQSLDDFKNAVEETITYCLENFTNPLIICTPIKNDLPDNSENTLKDYVDIIFELKEKYDFCIIDLYNNINFGSRFNAERKAEYIPDGIHPSNLGHTFIGSYINAKLNEFLPQIP